MVDKKKIAREAPKELEDCLLSKQETFDALNNLYNVVANSGVDIATITDEQEEEAVAKAQLEKCRGYIQSKLKPPKLIKECILPDDEMLSLYKRSIHGDCILCGLQTIVWDQLHSPKLATYIQSQVEAGKKAERERILTAIVEARKQITEEKERQCILEPKDRQAEMAFNSQLKGLQQAIDIVKQEVNK